MPPSSDWEHAPGLDLAFDTTLEPCSDQVVAEAFSLLEPALGSDRWQLTLAQWLAELAGELPSCLQAKAYSLGLKLVDDSEITALNTHWRNQSGPTDVLAFAAQDMSGFAPPTPDKGPDGSPLPLELGDIVISVHTAIHQAADHGHSLERELLFLASHGLLHLLGWDHPDQASLDAMLKRQDQLLENLSSLGDQR
jgi:probable rRNA maturation factor